MQGSNIYLRNESAGLVFSIYSSESSVATFRWGRLGGHVKEKAKIGFRSPDFPKLLYILCEAAEPWGKNPKWKPFNQ